MNANRYGAANDDVVVTMDAGTANRLLLALEMIDQRSGLDPVLAELRENVRASLSTKSSGDTDGAPSSGSA